MPRFQPGQSGNPNGRPKKERTLTAILEKAGNVSVSINGVKVSGKRALARMVWEGATTGTINFPDEQSIKLSPADWKDLVKWIYTHIDGPPKASDGESDQIYKIVVEYANSDDDTPA